MMHVGAIIGIVMGVVALLMAIGLLYYFLCRPRSHSHLVEEGQTSSKTATGFDNPLYKEPKTGDISSGAVTMQTLRDRGASNISTMSGVTIRDRLGSGEMSSFVGQDFTPKNRSNSFSNPYFEEDRMPPVIQQPAMQPLKLHTSHRPSLSLPTVPLTPISEPQTPIYSTQTQEVNLTVNTDNASDDNISKLPPPKPRRSPRLNSPESHSPPISRLGVTMDAQVGSGDITLIRDDSFSRSIDSLHIYDEFQKTEVQAVVQTEVQTVEPDANLVFAASLRGQTFLPASPPAIAHNVENEMSFIALSDTDLNSQPPSSELMASTMHALKFNMESTKDIPVYKEETDDFGMSTEDWSGDFSQEVTSSVVGADNFVSFVTIGSTSTDDVFQDENSSYLGTSQIQQRPNASPPAFEYSRESTSTLTIAIEPINDADFPSPSNGSDDNGFSLVDASSCDSIDIVDEQDCNDDTSHDPSYTDEHSLETSYTVMKLDEHSLETSYTDMKLDEHSLETSYTDMKLDEHSLETSYTDMKLDEHSLDPSYTYMKLDEHSLDPSHTNMNLDEQYFSTAVTMNLHDVTKHQLPDIKLLNEVISAENNEVPDNTVQRSISNPLFLSTLSIEHDPVCLADYNEDEDIRLRSISETQFQLSPQPERKRADSKRRIRVLSSSSIGSIGAEDIDDQGYLVPKASSKSRTASTDSILSIDRLERSLTMESRNSVDIDPSTQSPVNSFHARDRAGTGSSCPDIDAPVPPSTEQAMQLPSVTSNNSDSGSDSDGSIEDHGRTDSVSLEDIGSPGDIVLPDMEKALFQPDSEFAARLKKRKMKQEKKQERKNSKKYHTLKPPKKKKGHLEIGDITTVGIESPLGAEQIASDEQSVTTEPGMGSTFHISMDDYKARTTSADVEQDTSSRHSSSSDIEKISEDP